MNEFFGGRGRGEAAREQPRAKFIAAPRGYIGDAAAVAGATGGARVALESSEP